MVSVPIMAQDFSPQIKSDQAEPCEDPQPRGAFGLPVEACIEVKLQQGVSMEGGQASIQSFNTGRSPSRRPVTAKADLEGEL